MSILKTQNQGIIKLSQMDYLPILYALDEQQHQQIILVLAGVHAAAKCSSNKRCTKSRWTDKDKLDILDPHAKSPIIAMMDGTITKLG